MLKVGSLVESLKGHDLKRVYVVVDLQGEFAFVVDGKYRKLDKPKRKRIKHLLSLNKEMILPDEKKLFDFEIATFIKHQSRLHKDKSNY